MASILPPYRLADVFERSKHLPNPWDHCALYEQSIACEYLCEARLSHAKKDYRILANVVAKRILPRMREVMAIHLRVGDVLDKAPYMNWYGEARGSMYVRPLHVYRTMRVPRNVQSFHVYANYRHDMGTVVARNSMRYIQNVTQILRAHNRSVMVKNSTFADDDLVAMLSSRRAKRVLPLGEGFASYGGG